MGERVTVEVADSIATLTLDDGKVNVLSPEMQAEIHAALDEVGDAAVVVIAGRPGIFSAGFDLNTLRAGGPEAVGMLNGGFELAERVLRLPAPVIGACPGHAIAMGVFLLLSTDYRIGVDGPFRITANEVAIGLTLPRAAIEICRQRLTPAHFNRALLLAETYSPTDALGAGFLDRVVPASEFAEAVREVATGLAGLNRSAHAASKLRARQAMLTALRTAIEADAADLASLTG